MPTALTKRCRRFLTDYSLKTAEKSVEDYRKLTQDLWTKYNYQF